MGSSGPIRSAAYPCRITKGRRWNFSSPSPLPPLSDLHNTKWDEIWLSGADGVEWSHTFGGLPLPYHEGQTMELLFAQSASSDSSVLLLVANRSTERWVTYRSEEH